MADENKFYTIVHVLLVPLDPTTYIWCLSHLLAFSKFHFFFLSSKEHFRKRKDTAVVDRMYTSDVQEKNKPKI